mgnify:FL=1
MPKGQTGAFGFTKARVSWNDFAANGGILVAGGLVWWLGSNCPDLAVGVAVAGIFIWGGVKILRDANREHHKAVHGDDE